MNENETSAYLEDYAKLKGMTLGDKIFAALNYFRAKGYTQVSFTELGHIIDFNHWSGLPLETWRVQCLLKKKMQKMGFTIRKSEGDFYCHL